MAYMYCILLAAKTKSDVLKSSETMLPAQQALLLQCQRACGDYMSATAYNRLALLVCAAMQMGLLLCNVCNQLARVSHQS